MKCERVLLHSGLPPSTVPCGHLLGKETPQWIPPRTGLGVTVFYFPSGRSTLKAFVGALFLVPWPV